MPEIPWIEIGLRAATLAPFVLVLVEVSKMLGLTRGPVKALLAVVFSLSLSLSWWWVAMPHGLDTLFNAVLVGIASLGMATQVWDKVLKKLAGQHPTGAATTSVDKPADP